MANIIDYLQWRGDLDFTTDPFNAVDNLILARLSYIDFDDLPPRGETLSLLSQRYIESEEKMNPGLLLNEGNIPLLEEAGLSKRFGSVKIGNYVNKIDHAAQLQFCAMTFELDRKTAYIAFRGTDDTLVGWKEDFNMSFMEVVPAQVEAAAYLEQVLSDSAYKTVYVGGHSKGGNLAVYSSMRLDKGQKSRLAAVYNNDGPGFQKALIKSAPYREIAPLIVTLVPQSSVVGLLLEHEEQYRVVESDKKGLMQHDCFSWKVKGRDFISLPELKSDAQLFDKTTKRALEKMSLEQREIFATVLFDLLSVDESKTLTDLNKGGIGHFFKMSANYNKMDRDTKKVILETLSLFFDEGFKTFWEESELNQWSNKFRNWQQETRKEIQDFIKKL